MSIGSFEIEKNKKAFIYTAIICAILLLMAILISWKIPQPPIPVAQDLIEINLGNFDEGFGEIQPLIKGEKAPGLEKADQQQVASIAPTTENITEQTDDDKEAAPIIKPVNTTSKVTKPVQVEVPAKSQKPKFAGYDGPKGGTGNGATEDNGYKYQGNNPNGRGDAGNPTGKPDSYGNNPGGRSGGPRVTKGDRKVIRYYSFNGERDKATIYAIIKVSPEGKGTFIRFDKKSTSTNQAYANDIRQYLQNVQFDKADHESTVTVQFNFNVQ